MKEIVELLTLRKETISTMESATGGAVANAITNVEGASEVFSFGAVTYSNFYKEKFGVSALTIERDSVYSVSVAREMSREICLFTKSTYGVGITGKLGREDKRNLRGDLHTTYVSVYCLNCDHYITKEIHTDKDSREENKGLILDCVISLLRQMIDKNQK